MEIPEKIYCMACHVHRKVTDVHPVKFKNGTRAWRGTCPVCKAPCHKIFKGPEEGWVIRVYGENYEFWPEGRPQNDA